MSSRPFLNVLVVLPLLTAEPIAARTIFPAVGWPGPGADWDDHCPQDKFLVGFQGRVDLGISSIRVVCASISAEGRRGQLWYGSARGGSNGNMAEFSCPRDSVVMGLSRGTSAFYTPAPLRLGGINVLCLSRVSGARTYFKFGYGGSTPRPPGQLVFAQRCPSGEAGSGINGRTNAGYVLAVGLDCAVRLAS